MKLKPCPCGQTPTDLGILDGITHRWRYAVPNCCGEWIIEFGVDYPEYKGTIKRKAEQAWNNAPRENNQ